MQSLKLVNIYNIPLKFVSLAELKKNTERESEVVDTVYIPPIVQANVTTEARPPHRLLLITFPGNEGHDLHHDLYLLIYNVDP